MNPHNLFQKTIRLFGRSILLYAAIILLLYVVLNHDNALNRAQRRALNRIIPFMNHLAEFVEKGTEPSRKGFEEYLDYYRIVDAYIPGRDDTKAMLGFCYYHLGQYGKALSSYKKSIDLNPHFFWSYYNLGVLYFQKGDYQEAAEMFKKAIATKPDISVKIIFSSKLYREILNTVKNPRGAIEKSLKRGYLNCYRMLQRAEVLGKGQGPPGPFEGQEEMDLRIF